MNNHINNAKKKRGRAFLLVFSIANAPHRTSFPLPLQLTTAALRLAVPQELAHVLGQWVR